MQAGGAPAAVPLAPAIPLAIDLQLHPALTQARMWLTARVTDRRTHEAHTIRLQWAGSKDPTTGAWVGQLVGPPDLTSGPGGSIFGAAVSTPAGAAAHSLKRHRSESPTPEHTRPRDNEGTRERTAPVGKVPIAPPPTPLPPRTPAPPVHPEQPPWKRPCTTDSRSTPSSLPAPPPPSAPTAPAAAAGAPRQTAAQQVASYIVASSRPAAPPPLRATTGSTPAPRHVPPPQSATIRTPAAARTPGPPSYDQAIARARPSTGQVAAPASAPVRSATMGPAAAVGSVSISFKCHLCGYQQTRPDRAMFNTHLNIHPPKGWTGSICRCETCGAQFKTPTGLGRHRRRGHPSAKRYDHAYG